MDIMTP
jgi:hypothetical protein